MPSRADEYTITPVSAPMPTDVPSTYNEAWMRQFVSAVAAEVTELRRALHAAGEELRDHITPP